MSKRPRQGAIVQPKKCEYNGIVFKSITEMERYKRLFLLAQVGDICSLDPAPPTIEFACECGKSLGVTYNPDFTYFQDGSFIVEEVKGKGILSARFAIVKKLWPNFGHGKLRLVYGKSNWGEWEFTQKKDIEGVMPPK